MITTNNKISYFGFNFNRKSTLCYKERTLIIIEIRNDFATITFTADPTLNINYRYKFEIKQILNKITKI